MADKKSALRKMLESGCIGEFYTLNGYFFKVYPCFDIDKVKFAFVEKGKKGTGFDIYVGTDEFSLLCDDILSGVLAKKIAVDNGRYPSAWKYVTGENASKELAIGKSQKGGIVVQGRDKTNSKNAFVPLMGYDDLRILAKWYNMASGKTPVSGYYGKLCDILYEASQKIGRMHESYKTGADERYVSKAEETKEENAENAADSVMKKELFTTPGAQFDGRVYRIPVTEENGTPAGLLYVEKAVFDRLHPNQFERFIEQVNKVPLRIAINCKKLSDGYLFEGFSG